MNNLLDGAGCQWWQHDGGSAQSTFPTTGQGASTSTHTSSALYRARVVVIYKIHVTSAVGGDTLAIRTADASGVQTTLTGFATLDVGTTGRVYEFPGGLRIESTSANVTALTADASVLTIFYRKIA